MTLKQKSLHPSSHLLQASNWLGASRRYSQALKQLIFIGDKLPEDSKDEFEQLRVSCLLNLAACQGKLEQFEFVAENCTKVRNILLLSNCCSLSYNDLKVMPSSILWKSLV